MSLASQVTLLAQRIAAEIKTRTNAIDTPPTLNIAIQSAASGSVTAFTVNKAGSFSADMRTTAVPSGALLTNLPKPTANRPLGMLLVNASDQTVGNAFTYIDTNGALYFVSGIVNNSYISSLPSNIRLIGSMTYRIA